MDDNELKQMVTKMQISISKIEDALLGDEFRKDGLVKKVEKIEEKVETHDVYFKVVIALFIVIGVVLGIFIDIGKLL